MRRIYTNGAGRDVVLNPFEKGLRSASRLHLAAPYFTHAEPVRAAAEAGKTVQLLVGLNASTEPKALRAVANVPGLSVRYLTDRFHAKIYIFDDDALLGSSNLTVPGLMQNREAVICLEADRDREAIDEIKALFQELWEGAAVLTPEVLAAFQVAWERARKVPSRDAEIEDQIGRATPPNVAVESHRHNPARSFLEGLRREVFERYKPAFDEVTALLSKGGFRRPELAGIGLANETNRFLNWVRLTHVHGESAWLEAPRLGAAERRVKIESLGSDWVAAMKNLVPDEYVDWLQNVEGLFGDASVLQEASKDDLTRGLMSLHAFTEQSRFTKGGVRALPDAFWAANNGDVEKVRRTFLHLLHGPGPFIERLHDVLYDRKRKLDHLGRFTSLELYGTVYPEECPPLNSRMAKALRFLGFDVSGGG